MAEWLRLPSIRKHGMYAKIDEILSDPKAVIRTMERIIEEKERRKKAEANLTQAEKFIEASRPLTKLADMRTQGWSRWGIQDTAL